MEYKLSPLTFKTLLYIMLSQIISKPNVYRQSGHVFYRQFTNRGPLSLLSSTTPTTPTTTPPPPPPPSPPRSSSSVQPTSSTSSSIATSIFPSTTTSTSTITPPTFFQTKPLPTNTIIKFVPQEEAWIVERMGKFHRILPPGLAILAPIIDKISYVQNLKEMALELPLQNAITLDNVKIKLNGIIYIKIIDPYKASYGIDDYKYSILKLIESRLNLQIGKLELSKILKNRELLNDLIVKIINEAAMENWGIECIRFEIKDIIPPQNVVDNYIDKFINLQK